MLDVNSAVLDDEGWVRVIREAFPQWHTTPPTVAEVRVLTGCGQGRGVRLRRQACGLPAARTGTLYGPTGPDRRSDIADTVELAAVVEPPPPGGPVGPVAVRTVRTVRIWPILLLVAPAFVAVWSGWVGLGRLTGFGKIAVLPGIADGFVIDTAITLPIGVEVYAAFALRVWLTGDVGERARRFAMVSAIAALVVGVAGQVTFHVITAADDQLWVVTMVVASLPVLLLGAGAALAHLVRADLK